MNRADTTNIIKIPSFKETFTVFTQGGFFSFCSLQDEKEHLHSFYSLNRFTSSRSLHYHFHFEPAQNQHNRFIPSSFTLHSLHHHLHYHPPPTQNKNRDQITNLRLTRSNTNGSRGIHDLLHHSSFSVILIITPNSHVSSSPNTHIRSKQRRNKIIDDNVIDESNFK